MADLKTTNIYGDAYINNKVGIATNAPATRLQIGQLLPTAATEGIQFGDDTGARLHRINTGHIRATGGFSSATFVIADNYLQTNTNLIYPASQTATQRLEVGNASGNAWIDGLTIAQGGNVTVYNNLTVNNAATVTNDLTVNGNTYLGNAGGDTVFVNDIIRIGATDSGDASLFFGEGSVAGSDYGARWYWDSGYTFTWYTRNAGTDTSLFDYVTNDTTYLNWRRNFHMQNKSIDYTGQIHFNAGTRFAGQDTSILLFRSDSTSSGGIRVQNGSIATKGYTGYWDAGGGGILNDTGNWAVRYNFGSANSGGTLYGAWTVNGNISATNLSGTNTGDQSIGNGTITIAAGTGVGVGSSNTFTTNQSGATTVTITNNGVTALTTNTGLSTNASATGAVTITNTGVTNISAGTGIGTSASTGAVTITNNGVTSNVAGTGISVSGATGAVTITNGGVTSLAGTTNRVTVSAATGAVTLNLPQDIHTSASPTFSGLSLTSVSTTGATITNLTGAYQNTTVYDSPRTQSATPSRGIRSPASSIQFTDSYAIAPFYTYRSTGDWPVPYGIGWGTGGESSGIFQRYASNGSSFGDMIFYTGNDGSGAFSFRRHTWEGTTYFAAGSGELNTELFRIDWAGKATATSFALPGGFTITDPGSGYAAFSNWVLLGTTGFYSSTNSAHLHPNTGTYGSWKITGTRNGWGGIEFESGVSLMVNSTEVGFHRNGIGWQMRWSVGTGYIHKGSNGGGTEATILDSSNAAYAWNMNQYVRTTDSPTFNTVTANITGNAYNNLSNNYKDIYVYGDVNTYYVVLINGESLYSFGRYSVTRGYNWTGPDTWHVASHKGGLTLDWEWSGDTAWGGNDKAIRIIEFNESYSTMVAGLGYPVNGGVIIWLRGGGVNGALYRIRTPIGSNSTVTIYDNLSIAGHVTSTTFTAANSAVFSSRADVSNVSAEILVRYPVRATSGLYVDNNAVLHAGNYNSYSPTLTGTGASGTWGISVTGNAGTATILQTARNINGTSFNGSAAITTATWGTARTLTIGSTGKSVDGSAAITWSLAEIGAAATNQTMFIGTTSVAINRASAGQTLTGVSIDGNSGGIYAAGQAFIQTTSVGTSYVQHIQVREAAGGSGLTSETYAPALGFHWAGIVASNILMEASGRISIRNNPGTGYENFIAATITAGTSFSGPGTGLSGTATSLSIGGNAVTAGGLSVHGGTNNEANKIVRTDGNGYINAGWINTPSGDMPDTQSINRIYCSDDQYIRYKGVADFKQQIGLTYKNATPRSSNTTNESYWTGIMGWVTTDFNTMVTWGCGFIDSWGSPGNSPGAGYTHFVGVQALHYTNGDTDGTDNYGYQLVAGNGTTSPLYLRVNWGSAGSWRTMLDSSNYNSYSPSLTGNGASGTWSINVTGNAATATALTSMNISQFTNNSGYLTSVTNISGNAATATLATKASTLSQNGGTGTGMTFNWSGQGGQPTWLWGSNDGSNIYVWNPSNFSVNYATSAGSCTGNAASVSDGVYLSTNQSISGVKTFSSAPVATNIAKAWVHYNMNNNTINASYNVSSVTDNGTGVCTVNFSTSMVDANYVVAGTATYGYDDQDIYGMILIVPRRSTAQQAGSCRLATEFIHAAAVYDCVAVRAVFYR